MIRPRMLLLPLLLALPGLPARAEAPSASPSQVADAAHADVYTSIIEAVDENLVIDNISATMTSQMATADPAMAVLEKAYPGLSAAIVAAVRPHLMGYTRRVRELYRPRMIAVIAGHLTVAEAREVAAFYRSPVGRKLLGGVVRNTDGKNAMAVAIKDKAVTGEALTADSRSAVQRAMAGLTGDDFAEIGRQARAHPALLKLNSLAAALRPVRLEMENSPLIPAEEAAIQQAIETAVTDHLAKAVREPASEPARDTAK